MTNKSKKFANQSLNINLKEAKSLTDKQIIKFLTHNMDIDVRKIKVISNSVKPKPGIYSVVLSLLNEEGVYEEIQLPVKVSSKKKVYWIILSVIMTLVLISGLIWYKSLPDTVSSGLPKATNEKMSGAELKKYAEKKVDQSNVTLQVYPYISIKSDGQNGTMFIQNLPTNKTGQVAILKERDSGKVLYTTDLLKPGYQVSKIQIKRRLSRGEHKGLITLDFYDLKNEKKIGETNVAVEIYVK